MKLTLAWFDIIRRARRPNLKLQIDIEVQGGVLLVTARGDLAFDAALRLLKQAFDTAKEKEVNKILVNCLGLNGKLSTYERYNLGAELATYLRQGGIEPRLAFVGKPPTVDGFGVRVGQKSRRNHRGVFEPARSGELACNLATLSHLRAFGTRANTRHKSAPTREKQPGQAHQQGRWVPTKLYHPNLLSPFTIIVELFGTPVAIHFIVSDPG